MFNAGGFFDGLLAFLDSVVAEGFVREPHRAMLIVGTEPPASWRGSAPTSRPG